METVQPVGSAVGSMALYPLEVHTGFSQICAWKNMKHAHFVQQNSFSDGNGAPLLILNTLEYHVNSNLKHYSIQCANVLCKPAVYVHFRELETVKHKTVK